MQWVEITSETERNTRVVCMEPLRTIIILVWDCSNNELFPQEEKLASSTKLHKDSSSSTNAALTERQTY